MVWRWFSGFGSQKRVLYKQDGSNIRLGIRRLKYRKCQTISHELSDIVIPYKRYEANTIAQALPALTAQGCGCETSLLYGRNLVRCAPWLSGRSSALPEGLLWCGCPGQTAVLSATSLVWWLAETSCPKPCQFRPVATIMGRLSRQKYKSFIMNWFMWRGGGISLPPGHLDYAAFLVAKYNPC